MSKRSEVGNTWSTKLERIGKVAKTNLNTVFNNIGHVIDSEMLRDCYRQLDGNKAVGIDKVSKDSYGANLDQNLDSLLVKIRRGIYRPQPCRIIEIPKEDGSTRPLAIACFEDKIVQLAVSKLLEAIYEPMFLPSSFGFRRNLNCHQALRALAAQTYRNQRGAVVEIDLKKYFNTIPHKILESLLKRKISDRRFLNLLHTLITAPIIEEGQSVPNTIGCPQGSIGSPILSNIYLHYVLDDWFLQISKTHIIGKVEQVRYADDMVFIFQHEAEAKRFFKVLPKRLKKYGLELHMDKSQIIKSGNIQAKRAHKQGKRLPTYQFLGFTCYWGLVRKGDFWRLKYTSRKDRFNAKLKEIRKLLRKNLNPKSTTRLLERIKRMVQGWINYHAISDNKRRVHSFIFNVKRLIFKWFNRRGGRKYIRWTRANEILNLLGFPSTWKTTSMFSQTC